MSDVCSSWIPVTEPTKADDNEWNCHADCASLASCRSLEDANPRIGIPGSKDLFFNVLDDQHIGDDCYKTQATVDDRRSEHHAWDCDRGVFDLDLCEWPPLLEA